jgi:DNA-binding NtrC family response regulator
MTMTAQIALVDHDHQHLTMTENALQQAGFVVAAFADPLFAWDHLKRRDTDLLLAKAGALPGQPSRVALARGGLHANPDLRVVLLANEHEVEYAEDLGDLLCSSLPQDSVARQVIELLKKRKKH